MNTVRSTEYDKLSRNMQAMLDGWPPGGSTQPDLSDAN